MRRVLLLPTFLIGSSAFGALVQCSPASGPLISLGAGTSTLFTCDTSALAGNALGDGINVTSMTIRIELLGSAEGSNGQVFGVTATTTNSASLTNPAATNLSCTVVANSFCINSAAAQATTGLAVDQFSTFTVTVAGSQNGQLSLFNISATASVFYDYTTAPGVPEPGTFVLLGSAVAALGLFYRRQ